MGCGRMVLPAKQYTVQLNMEERRDLKGLAWPCAIGGVARSTCWAASLKVGLGGLRFSATGSRPSDTTTRLAAAWVLASASPTVGYPTQPDVPAPAVDPGALDPGPAPGGSYAEIEPRAVTVPPGSERLLTLAAVS